jgi:hypothetical protein
LYHSDGMLFISTGTFGFSVTSTTSFSYLQTNATFTGQVLDAPLRTAVTSFQSTGGELHLARAGGSTGVNSILKYNASGFDVLIQNAALPSGNTTSIEGEGNTLWVATPGAILKGEYNASSAIEWMNGWTTPVGAVTTDILLDGTDLYITTTESGLLKLDTITGDIISINGAQHNNQAGLAQAIDSSGAEQLIIGLLGSATTSSGVQSFDLGSQQFTLAALLAGLPSNAIQGFTFSSDSLYIATSNGIGQWNFTASAWENPLTIEDGFPDSFIGDVFWASNTLYAASLSGMTQYIPTTGASTTLKQSDGLLGNSVASFGRYTTTNQGTWLIAVHDAALGERPGLSVVNISSNTVVSTHRFDQLPSNTVTSVTADYGGVHIATDTGALTHYNGLTDQFIAGISSADVPSWPIRDMESDGVHLILRSSSSISIVEARNTSHSLLKSFVISRPQNVAVGPTGFWAATQYDGLVGWNKAFEAIPDGVARTANPLFASIDGQVFNIGEMAHPGNQIKLVTPDDSLSLNSSVGIVDGNGVLFQYVPLALTSPNSNASVWAKTVELNYSAEMTISDPSNLEEMLQLAIDNGQILNQTRYVPLKLLSAGNGTLEVRLTYDWVRKDTPVVITDAYDRPDDGGSALSIEWSNVPDIDFKAYHVYLNDGPWDGLVTDISFEGRIADASESAYTRTVAVATTANGVSIVDGTEYYALVVVEYQDGRYGVPSSIAGPLVTSDEVPTPPAWATAVPFQDGEEGELSVEWARCMALDAAQTNIYTSTLPITDAVGLASQANIQYNEENNTTLSVSTGLPYWIAFTCIDATGQEDVANATVIGPVIATGGEDDGLPPAPLTNVFATDTPEDNGGRITVGWDASNSEDCAFYQIFMVTDVEFSFEPTSVGGFTGSKIITDCSSNSTIVSDFDGAPLIDGQEYYIGVIAYDMYLNAQRTGVEIVTAVPIDNLNGEVLPPNRVTSIEVFDTPNDDGTSIDISWSVSDSDDFGYYIVWTADRPLTNVASLWNEYGTNPDLCGCVVIDKQWVDEDKEPFALTANTGLYYSSDDSGNTINVSAKILPNTKLYVAVTVHNGDGEAHFTGLLNPNVTPINNLQDDVAPERIENLTLQDRPLDDGTGVNLEFQLSTESDIFEYQVYAAPFDFTSVGNGSNGPLTPVLITDRAPDFPLSITQLTGDFEVTPQLTVWIAVVPVDFAGNAIMKDLTTVSAQSIDDGFANDGSGLPSIEGIMASWIEGEKILIEWNQTESELIEGYQIHISADNFSLIDNATLIGDGISTASFIVSNDNFAALTNTSNWYVSVTPYDSENVKQSVETIQISAIEVALTPGDGENEFSIKTLLSSQNFIAAGVVLAVLVLLVTFSRSRKGRSDISKAWDSQASTWGMDEDNQMDAMFSPEIPPPQGFTPGPMPPMGGAMMQQPLPPMPAGLNQPAQPAQPMYAQPPQPTQPVQSSYALPPQPAQPVQPIQQAAPVIQQQNQVQPSANIDVSFLDELL